MVILLAGGCQRAQVAEPLTAEMGGNDPDSQMSFWHTLAERTVTSNDEAFHALLLFVDGRDDATDYEGRVAAMNERNMLPRGFDRPANEGATRGTIAVALVRALEIKGGVMLRILGPTPRYAVRELQYLNIYPQSSTHQTFAGGEFIEIMGRAEDHQRQFKKTAPAEQIVAAAKATGSEPAGPTDEKQTEGQGDAAASPQ
jgi:hypothetical protein